MAEREPIGNTPWVTEAMIGRSAAGGVCPTEGNLGGYVRTNAQRLCTGWDVRYAPQQPKTAENNTARIVGIPHEAITAAAD